MKKLILMLFVLVATQINLAKAQGVVISSKPGWHKIGEKTADFSMESETISVIGADKFKAVKLKATDAPINVISMDIYFQEGEKQEVSVKAELKPGEETKEISLNGERAIKKVVFVYKTIPNAKEKKAHLELYGLK